MDLYINVSDYPKFNPLEISEEEEKEYIKTCKLSYPLAIKQVNDKYGLGLRDAREYIDELKKKYGDGV